MSQLDLLVQQQIYARFMLSLSSLDNRMFARLLFQMGYHMNRQCISSEDVGAFYGRVAGRESTFVPVQLLQLSYAFLNIDNYEYDAGMFDRLVAALLSHSLPPGLGTMKLFNNLAY